MGKEKKSFSGSNPANKNNRNIQKQSPHNPRSNAKHHRGNSNPRDNGRKKSNNPSPNEYELPPMKSRSGNNGQACLTGIGLPNAPIKKIITARPEQVQETITQLKALENLLNSYQELQMDENANVKSLVEGFLQKQIKKE